MRNRAFAPRGSRRILAFTALCTVAVVTAGIAGMAAPARAQSTDSKPGTLINSPDDPVNIWMKSMGATYFQNQESLDSLKEWIITRPGDPTGRYLDQVDDVNADSTTLLWAGPLTDPFIEAALTEAHALGVQATIQQRPFPLSVITAAESALDSSQAELKAAGFTLNEIDGVGSENSDIDAVGVVAPGVDVSKLQTLLSSIAKIPITVDSGTTLLASRQADTSPFYAGGFMDDPAGETCSTGFTMIYEGKPHTTTARHCIPAKNEPGYGWYSYSGDGRQGQIIYTGDTGAVNVLAGTGGPWAYDGSWDNSSGYAKAVADEHTPAMGENVCTGGGQSGEHCGAKIIKSGVDLIEPRTGLHVSTVEAQVSSGIAVAQGDSGGPVIQPIGSGADSGEVHAVGMIQGMDDPNTGGNCPSMAQTPGPYCSDKVLFSWMSTITNHNPLTVDTY